MGQGHFVNHDGSFLNGLFTYLGWLIKQNLLFSMTAENQIIQTQCRADPAKLPTAATMDQVGHIFENSS